MNKVIGLLLVAIMSTALLLGDALGRGFGGFRGGGLGGFSGRGFGGDRFGGDRFGGDRFAGDRMDGDRFGGDRFDGDRFRGDLGGRSRNTDFGGLRDDRDGSRGGTYRSEGGTRLSEGGSRDRQGFVGDRMGDGSRLTRGDLNRFLGMPTDAGLGSVAGNREGRRFEGTRMHAGRVEGPLGGSAAFVSRSHMGYVRPSVLNARGRAVRNSFYERNLFTPGWYHRHPNVWVASAVAASAWAAATWSGVSEWLDCDSFPEDYDYGSGVLYQGDTVYVEGQPVGSAEQYYDQAASLADSRTATQDDQSQWMSLGVFALVQGSQTDATMIFQLAVNRQGIIKGTLFNKIADTTLPVHGAVDKKTQRVAWTVDDNKSTVFDTGLYNLTKDQAPALVHFGKDRTQQWLLVRLKREDEKNDNS